MILEDYNQAKHSAGNKILRGFAVKKCILHQSDQSSVIEHVQ